MQSLRVRWGRDSDDFIIAAFQGPRDQFEPAKEELKDQINPRLRSFDPDRRCWRVDPRAYREFRIWLRFVERLGGIVERQFDDEPDPEPKRDRNYRKPWRPEPRQLSPYQHLCLAENAPIELVRAAKKALATLYHPDRPTGDLERMKLVNAAADEIESRKGRAA